MEKEIREKYAELGESAKVAVRSSATAEDLSDTFFVGRLDNRAMIAAIGIVFSFVSIIQAIGFWLGYGSGNAMSKKIGEQDYAEAETISSSSLG